jgi:rare lipoprotein A
MLRRLAVPYVALLALAMYPTLRATSPAATPVATVAKAAVAETTLTRSTIQKSVISELVTPDPAVVAASDPVAPAEDAEAIPLPRPRPSILAAASTARASAETGLGSYYHEPQTVACGGGALNTEAMTAAHRSLPCGTVVKVTNTKNGRYALVQINDRGPFVDGRIIDVSQAAARNLDMIGRGVVPVRVEVMANR